MVLFYHLWFSQIVHIKLVCQGWSTDTAVHFTKPTQMVSFVENQNLLFILKPYNILLTTKNILEIWITLNCFLSSICGKVTIIFPYRFQIVFINMLKLFSFQSKLYFWISQLWRKCKLIKLLQCRDVYIDNCSLGKDTSISMDTAQNVLFIYFL